MGPGFFVRQPPWAAIWKPGDYAPGAGAMVILTDIDFITTPFGGANYTSLNDKGRLGLNTAAFLALNASANVVPEPGSAVVWGLIGLGGMFCYRKRHPKAGRG